MVCTSYLDQLSIAQDDDFWVNRLKGIKRWLKRSGQMPLSLSLIGNPLANRIAGTGVSHTHGSWEAYYAFAFQVGRLFASQSHRWKSLTLDHHFFVQSFLYNPGQKPSIIENQFFLIWIEPFIITGGELTQIYFEYKLFTSPAPSGSRIVRPFLVGNPMVWSNRDHFATRFS
jgi:hypothetical protein